MEAMRRSTQYNHSRKGSRRDNVCPEERYQVYHSSATNRMIATWHHTSQYAFNSLASWAWFNNNYKHLQFLDIEKYSNLRNPFEILFLWKKQRSQIPVRDAKVLLEALGTRPVELGGSILTGAAKSGPAGPVKLSQNSPSIRIKVKNPIRCSSNSGWWWLEHVVFFHLLGIIIPTD